MDHLDDVPRILCVDDEPHVTAGIQRMFFDDFIIDTAESGDAALQLMVSEDPYDVVVSDMRMPGMDGATFLSRARGIDPDCTRILLTGHAEVNAAIAAVNEGSVFRFLCKPCPQDVLRDAIQAGVTQRKLVMSERDLLERTLQGVVELLTGVISTAAPAAFVHTGQVKRCIEHLSNALGLEDTWELQLAALLSHLGFIALPPDTLAAHASGRELDASEQALVDNHRQVAYRLLHRIPRLNGVAAIVGGPGGEADLSRYPSSVARDTKLLALAMELDSQLEKAPSPAAALRSVGEMDAYPSEWLAHLEGFVGSATEAGWVVKELTVKRLMPGMRTEEAIRSPSGSLLVPKDRELTASLIERLRSFAERDAVAQPCIVGVLEG